MNNIELLSPAGDFERLRMAVTYGADAVYLAGREFGMRASTCNFSDSELINAVTFCHTNGVKIYITCNTLPREHEIDRLRDYLLFLYSIHVDAIIVADLGVFMIAKEIIPDMKVHISTQLGVVNSATANALYNMGADTVVLARELSLNEIREIRNHTPDSLKLEAFVHGSMCVSFSGRCLLSNYLTGRDSNRGMCAQPCRWKYHIVEETRPGEYFPVVEDNGTFILNSRDLCMIEHIKDLIEAGVSSMKIEGRMKSAYYTAIVTGAYRKAIDCYRNNEPLNKIWIDETLMVSHRPYSTGFYYGEPGEHYDESSYSFSAVVLAIVESCDSDGNAVLSQRNKFYVGDTVQLVIPESEPIFFEVKEISDLEGNLLNDTRKAMMRFRMKLPCYAPELSIIRKLC